MVIKRKLRSNSTSAPAPESQTAVAAVATAAQPVAPLSPDDWQADDTAQDQMLKVERRGRPRKTSGNSGTESVGEDGGSSNNSTKNGYDSGTNANSNGNSVASNSSASNVNNNNTTTNAATATTTTTITTSSTSTTTTTTSGSSNNGSASTPKAPPKRIIRLKPPNPSKRRKTESTDAKRHGNSDLSPSAERRSDRSSSRMPESHHGNGTRASGSTVKSEQAQQRAASEVRENLTKWQPRRWGRRRVVLRTTSGEFAVPIWCSTEKRQAPPVSR